MMRVILQEFVESPQHLHALPLDRLLHHAETVVIEGKSYRMKGKLGLLANFEA